MGWRAGGYGRRFRQAVTLALVAASISACAPLFQNHGYVPAESDLALLTVGVDTQDTVASTIGRPSAQTLLDESGWYYVQSRYRTVGPREPKEIDRQVVAISFDPDGVVTNIERFGLEQGRVVALSRRVTEGGVARPSLISELFKNFGRLRAADFLN
jgi:outer membrane protein assembly factor BamE (lipoprotein component of BamABCDE complex)